MNRTMSAVLVVLLCVFPVVSQAQATDKKLMSDADYKVFLSQVEAALPKWETALNNLDLERIPQISYSRGKLIADRRDIGLMMIGNIRQFVGRQRTKRTVSGELALLDFMRSLYDMWGDIVWGAEDFSGLNLANLEEYAPELSALEIRIGNDVTARVGLLEKGTCP